jgi:signal transduction histidine kinase
MTLIVPLDYTGSVLALTLAAGATSGVGVVIPIPLLWTALFHQKWESACIVAATVAVEVIISVTPVAVPGAVIARRVILRAALGTVISVAIHGLRDRVQRSQEETARLYDRLRELSVAEDRDRVAADLQDKVSQRAFAAGLTLQGAATLTAEPEARRRVQASIDDLDHVVGMLRDTILGLDHRTKSRGLRQEILDLCSDVSRAPKVSFSGPVDGALQPGTATQLPGMLRDSLSLAGEHAVPARISTTADDDCFAITVGVTPADDAGTLTESAPALDSLRDAAIRAGIRIAIARVAGGTRFAWEVPLNRSARSRQP